MTILDQEKREQIKTLNEKLFKSIVDNNVTDIKSLMAEQLLTKADYKFTQLIDRYSRNFKGTRYKLLNEYNTQNSKIGSIVNIPSGRSDSDYVLRFPATNKEMYVSILLVTDSNNESLLTAFMVRIIQIGN